MGVCMLVQQGKHWLNVKVLIALAAWLVWFSNSNAEHVSRQEYREGRRHRHGLGSDIIRQVAREVVGIHYNILDWDTFKVLVGTFPFFVSARMIDEDLQSCFYERAHHKNIHQFPHWCHDVANWAISVPIAFLALHSLFPNNEEYCETNKTFLIGVVFVVSAKALIKKLDLGFCQRPWHEKFSCEKRALGGFPSGHMAEVTYITLLYGLRYGPMFAIPFTLLAIGVGATFLNCNRHYLSQLVGGAALGAIYALAAYKFIDQKLCQDLSCSLSVNEHGSPAIAISYSF
jgi:hypothetical protein